MQCEEHNYIINYKANILEDNICAQNFSAFCEENTRVFHELNGSGVLTQPLLAGWFGPGGSVNRKVILLNNFPQTSS